MTWNDHSDDWTWEVVLVLEGEAVVDYYGRAFESDWRGGTGGPPTWLVLAALAAVVSYRRIDVRTSTDSRV